MKMKTRLARNQLLQQSKEPETVSQDDNITPENTQKKTLTSKKHNQTSC